MKTIESFLITKKVDNIEPLFTIEEMESILSYYNNSYLALSKTDLSVVKKLSKYCYSKK